MLNATSHHYACKIHSELITFFYKVNARDQKRINSSPKIFNPPTSHFFRKLSLALFHFGVKLYFSKELQQGIFISLSVLAFLQWTNHFSVGLTVAFLAVAISKTMSPSSLLIDGAFSKISGFRLRKIRVELKNGKFRIR